MKVPSSVAIGHTIRALRERSNQSLAQVSRGAGITSAELASIESGRSRPTIATLHGVARAVGSTLVELVHDARASGHASEDAKAPPASRAALTLPDIARAIAELPAGLGSKVDAAGGATVLYAMSVTGDNQSAAARLLGMERKAFVRRLARARRRAKKTR